MLAGAKKICSVTVCIAWCCVEKEIHDNGKDRCTVASECTCDWVCITVSNFVQEITWRPVW